MKQLFVFPFLFIFMGASAQNTTLKKVVSLEQAVKTQTIGWVKMYVQENDSTLHVWRIKSDGQKAKIQDLGTLFTDKGDAWKGTGFSGPKVEEKKDPTTISSTQEKTTLFTDAFGKKHHLKAGYIVKGGLIYFSDGAPFYGDTRTLFLD